METLILASGSASRRAMLEAAGVPIVVDKPELDEGAIKRTQAAAGASVEEAAQALALAKGEAVSARQTRRLVLAADQMLECEGDWFDKPADPTAAARQLMRLAGRQHRLISAAVVLRDGRVLWRETDIAILTMRPFGEDFVRDYLARTGDRVLGSVGVYQVEGLGVQLFEAIEGSHYTILGLPLLPLLKFLRAQGVISS